MSLKVTDMADIVKQEGDKSFWKDVFIKLFESSKVVRCKNKESESGHSFCSPIVFHGEPVRIVIVCRLCGKTENQAVDGIRNLEAISVNLSKEIN